MFAAAKADKKIIELLLDRGADIFAEDGKGNSVLTAAKESKDKEFIALIEEKIRNKSKK